MAKTDPALFEYLGIKYIIPTMEIDRAALDRSFYSFLADPSSHDEHSPARGWYFGVGNPEFWKFRDQLVVPGGKVLDLGAKTGRSSVPFAMWGMMVTAIDNSEANVTFLTDLAKSRKLSIEAIQADVTKTHLGFERYDLVLHPLNYAT